MTNQAPPVTAIVLSGGRSSRMGRDKAGLMLDGETFLARSIAIARQVAGDVIVATRRSQALPSGVRAVHDDVEDQGPLAGIAAGLASSNTDLNIVMACDMPLIRPAVLERLLASISDHDACVAMVDGHPSVLCGVYRSRVAPVARQMFDDGERRVTALVDRLKTKRVDAALLRDIDPHLETFVSFDTPEAYERLRTGTAARQSPGA